MPATASAASLAALHDRPHTPAGRAALEPTVPLALPPGLHRVPLRSLPPVCAAIPDPRRAHGRRHPLLALLATTLAALLCPHLARHPEAALALLGLTLSENA